MGRVISENEHLESIRADIRTLRSARKSLIATDDHTQRTARALEALDRKLVECVIELSRLRGYVPRHAPTSITPQERQKASA